MKAITLAQIKAELDGLNNPPVGAFLQRFFKTGVGEYGHGDRFRGIRVPELKKLARKYKDISLETSEKLLRSAYHEDRLLALLTLISVYQRSDDAGKEKVFDLYLRSTRFVNNWDLVDSSAAQIVGAFLWDRERDLLYRLAKSENLWERRIAIIATFHFIRRGEFEDTFKIAGMLLSDREDLIHKAVGWMLREVGNRDLSAEENFLKSCYRQMPRTMLRYAIEKFPEAKRQRYLKGQI